MNILFVTPYYVTRHKSSADGFMTYLHRDTQGLLSLGHRQIILECGKNNGRWVEDVVNYDDHFISKYLTEKICFVFGLLALRKGIEIIGQCLEQF